MKNISLSLIVMLMVLNALKSQHIELKTMLCAQDVHDLSRLDEVKVFISSDSLQDTLILADKWGTTYYFKGGTDYQIRTYKEGYYPLDTTFKTATLEKFQKSRLGLMLQPILCFNVKGILKDKITGIPVKTGKLLIVGIESKDSIWTEVENGMFDFCGKCGEHYSLNIRMNGYLSVQDTIQLSAENCFDRTVLKLDLNLDVIPSFKDGYYTGDTIQMTNLKFKGKTTELTTIGDMEVRKLVEILKSIPELNVKILIHTDANLSHRYNQLLSDKRADIVASYLEKSGINVARFKVEGVGEKYIVSSQNAAANRRGELIILHGNLERE